ncbi:hypothetical protein Q8W30_14765 [Neptunomonas phycophila]|uniref:DUF2975 domain-containing protein n=1 Tax=Neptunomonas phycophila TaxID=1572645 RepID=A0ABT9EXS1_9GAMM|nr:hypothetical protein [Neptunomonas phycophila]MDP2523835.1 hypothetical protein [Neptunomonas phycophila]
MKMKLLSIKNVVIFFWLLNSTVYLYWLNSIETDGVMDFLKFTALLFGAGVTYDILVKLRALSPKAKRLMRILPFFFGMAVVCQIVSTIIVFFVLGKEGSHYISLGLSFMGIFGAIYVAVRLGTILDKMLELENV